MYQAAEDRAAMPPSFVLEFAALLALGPVAALLVSGAIVLLRRRIANGVAVTVATVMACYTHYALGGTTGGFVWPFQAVPIAAAVAAYSFVKVMAMQVVTPWLTKQPITRAWPKTFLRECPIYFIGAGVAVGLVEVIDHRNWAVLPVALVPLVFAFRAYADYMSRLEDGNRRLEVIDALQHGLPVDNRIQPGQTRAGAQNQLGRRRGNHDQ